MVATGPEKNHWTYHSRLIYWIFSQIGALGFVNNPQESFADTEK
jgi:hypothetical protein